MGGPTGVKGRDGRGESAGQLGRGSDSIESDTGRMPPLECIESGGEGSGDRVGCAVSETLEGIGATGLESR